MNRKRNISYVKPEDPHFLKVMKKQAGYDDKNHKFDELQNDEKDFVEDTESEQPQIVVVKEGDLTADEVKTEIKRLKKEESEEKADLRQRVIFKSKPRENKTNNMSTSNKKSTTGQHKEIKKQLVLLYFDDEQDSDQ